MAINLETNLASAEVRRQSNVTHTSRRAILYIAIRRVPGRVIEQQVHDVEASALEDAFPRPFSSFPLGSARMKRSRTRERKNGAKRWAAKGRAHRLYRLLIVRLRAIISSENGHFHARRVAIILPWLAGYYY